MSLTDILSDSMERAMGRWREARALLIDAGIDPAYARSAARAGTHDLDDILDPAMSRWDRTEGAAPDDVRDAYRASLVDALITIGAAS